MSTQANIKYARKLITETKYTTMHYPLGSRMSISIDTSHKMSLRLGNINTLVRVTSGWWINLQVLQTKRLPGKAKCSGFFSKWAIPAGTYYAEITAHNKDASEVKYTQNSKYNTAYNFHYWDNPIITTYNHARLALLRDKDKKYFWEYRDWSSNHMDGISNSKCSRWVLRERFGRARRLCLL